MQLNAAFGLALFHTKGPVGETDAAWTHALTIAESFADVEYQLRALWGFGLTDFPVASIGLR